MLDINMNKLVSSLTKPFLNENEDLPTYGVFPGKFKPPHKGHFEVAKHLAEKCDNVVIIVSPKMHDGITAEQAVNIWHLYLPLLPGNIEVKISPSSPVTDTYNFITTNPDMNIFAAFGKVDGRRYNSILKQQNLSHAQVFDGGDFEGVSATELRDAIKKGDEAKIKTLIPQGVDVGDFMRAIAIEPEITANINEVKDDKNNIIRTFIKFAIKELQIKQPLGKIRLSTDNPKAKEESTFGYFDPNTKEIWIYVKNRNTADILRTLAHELVHRKQEEDGRLDSMSGETGSEIENEANAQAGVLLRKFGQQNKEIYEIKINPSYSVKAKLKTLRVGDKVRYIEPLSTIEPIVTGNIISMDYFDNENIKSSTIEGAKVCRIKLKAEIHVHILYVTIDNDNKQSPQYDDIAFISLEKITNIDEIKITPTKLEPKAITRERITQMCQVFMNAFGDRIIKDPYNRTFRHGTWYADAISFGFHLPDLTEEDKQIINNEIQKIKIELHVTGVCSAHFYGNDKEPNVRIGIYSDGSKFGKTIEEIKIYPEHPIKAKARELKVGDKISYKYSVDNDEEISSGEITDITYYKIDPELDRLVKTDFNNAIRFELDINGPYDDENADYNLITGWLDEPIYDDENKIFLSIKKLVDESLLEKIYGVSEIKIIPSTKDLRAKYASLNVGDVVKYTHIVGSLKIPITGTIKGFKLHSETTPNELPRNVYEADFGEIITKVLHGDHLEYLIVTFDGKPDLEMYHQDNASFETLRVIKDIDEIEIIE